MLVYVVFIANVILAQLTVKHASVRVPAQVYQTNEGQPYLFCFAYTCSISHLNGCANPRRLSTYKPVAIPKNLLPPSLIPTHLQIPFHLSAHTPWPIPKHLLTPQMPSPMPRCLPKEQVSLDKVCSAQNLLNSVQHSGMCSVVLISKGWCGVALSHLRTCPMSIC